MAKVRAEVKLTQAGRERESSAESGRWTQELRVKGERDHVCSSGRLSGQERALAVWENFCVLAQANF